VTDNTNDIRKYVQDTISKTCGELDAPRVASTKDELEDSLLAFVRTNEAKSGGDEAYDKFLKKKLKDAGYKSFEDIPKVKKDDFFNSVEKEWDADDEK